MNKEEALLIAQKVVDTMRISTPSPVLINDMVTEEYPIGFVFYYNTEEYWQTRDLSKSLAGNGPILVRKNNGDALILPSNKSAKKSIGLM